MLDLAANQGDYWDKMKCLNKPVDQIMVLYQLISLF